MAWIAGLYIYSCTKLREFLIFQLRDYSFEFKNLLCLFDWVLQPFNTFKVISGAVS